MTLLLLVSSLSGAARAQAACDEPLTETLLEAALDDATSAIRNADVRRHQEVVRELEAAIPCLEVVPRPEQWAEVLVGIAIVAHALDDEWQAPLTTALTIHPRVNRLVGASHEIASWEPPSRPEPSEEVAPEGVRVFYDGELVTQIPRPGGLHLVQRRDGDGLQSILLRDAPIPASWLVAPTLESKRRDLGWGFVGFGSGAVSHAQTPAEPGNFLPERVQTGPTLMVGGHGWLRLSGPVGVRFALAASVLDLQADASLAPSWAAGMFTVSAGVGARTVEVISGAGEQSFLLAYPDVGLAVQPTSGLTLSANAGWAPWITQARFRADHVLGAGSVRAAGGLEARFVAARFELLAEPVRELPVTSAQIGAHIGIRWGNVR